MDRKHRRMIEGSLYLFSLPRDKDKATISTAIDDTLDANDCGRVLGSGTSLANDNTIIFEIGSYNRDMANEAISRVCRRMKCKDFEMVWD